MKSVSMERAVRDAEAARARALVAQDWATLDAWIDDTLHYVHATGVVHDRAQWFDFLRTGPTFLAVDVALRQVRVMGAGRAESAASAGAPGTFALADGTMRLRLQRPGAPVLEARSAVSQAWVLRPTGWKLAMMQSTRLPDPTPSSAPA